MPINTCLLLVFYFLSAFAVAGCAEPEDEETEAAASNTAIQEDNDTENAPDLPEVGELMEVAPGGDTICSRGTPFRFFVYGGDPDRIVIDFQGGGACWNEITCSIEDAIFKADAGRLEEIEAAMDEGKLQGIYDFDNTENPFHGWTLIHIPYCTGDIHWGDATVDYSDELTIHHRGYQNVKAVLEWVYARYDAPTHIMATGCSAGAYGAIGHAPFLQAQYPDTDIAVLADSGAGVITDDFLEQSFPNWNAAANMPLWLDGIAGKEISELTLVDLYLAVAHQYPEMRVAQYNTAYDADQIFYYTAMGGEGDEWTVEVRESLSSIRENAENFRHYFAPGPIHCIHPYDVMYQREVDGVPYTSWLSDFIEAATLPADIVCEDDACQLDPICDACATEEIESSACYWCNGWP